MIGRQVTAGRALGPLVCVALLAAAFVALTVSPALAATSVEFDAPAHRLAGSDRFATSVAIARDSFPGWTGVDHVVVASGDTGIADALTATGLCWAYDAPLLLVSTDRLPSSVSAALREIVAANPDVRIHIVGGVGPVPRARVIEMLEIVGSGRSTRTAGSDRYATARDVALRMRDIAASRGETLPPGVLLANGSDDAHVVDALVFSTVTAGTGMPLLLVEEDGVPTATSQALAMLGSAERYVAGGTAAVSRQVVAELRAMRIAGADRYATASRVAEYALGRGWLGGDEIGVAAAVPDALTGSALMGRRGGALLLTDPVDIPKATAGVLGSMPSSTTVLVFGGTGVVGGSVERQLLGYPGSARLTSLPSGTDKCGPRIPLRITTGVNTSRVLVYRGDRLLEDISVGPFSSVDLGDISATQGTNTLRIVARNDDGETTEQTHRRVHLGPTWDTYIVIDKSDYRLYFVKNGVLDSWYPIAHGRNNRTPLGTWRIDAKYYSDPNGVYGPRKMRLYRYIGSGRYSFSPYLVHGTNQPWVIGTMASAGCIRMYNSDVLKLYPKVPLGTMVVTRP